jgi:polysaccharide pyruvyl transferase WcaK-like protein
MMPGSPDITTLLDVYERTRLLIGTRMHSCVFAMSVGTPFVAIAYDAGPKWDILKQFWPEEFVFDYSSSPASVAQAARRLYIDGPTIQSTAAARFHALAEQSFDNVRHL